MIILPSCKKVWETKLNLDKEEIQVFVSFSFKLEFQLFPPFHELGKRHKLYPRLWRVTNIELENCFSTFDTSLQQKI